MARMTKRFPDGKTVVVCDSCEQKMDKQCTFDECRTSLIKRLAAYEDTGLEPEAVETVKLALAAKHLVDLETLNNAPISRLVELAEADKDGRVLILPCKVGDPVWRIVRDGEPHITRDEVRDMYFADDMTLCVELVGGRVTFTEKFGKTVFLTREEAERALQEMEGKKDGNETSM